MNAAVIMAGGVGTRLFPASTAERPKQFVQWPAATFAEEPEAPAPGRAASLLQQSYHRILPLTGPSRVFVATTADLAGAVREQLPELPEQNVIIEPSRRNSAAACALATARVASLVGPETTVMILPSDAAVSPDGLYQDTLRTAATLAWEQSGIVVVGIRPSRPATGYGYVRPGERLATDCYHVAAFVEKPDVRRAESLVDEGCLWNAGIFVWRADVARRAFETLLPIHGRLFSSALSEANLETIFQEMPTVSVDVGIAERWEKMFCVAGHFDWDDLGTWDAFGRVFPQDAGSNVALGQVRLVGSDRCVVIADEGEVVALGVSDLVIVRYGDRVLVCPRDRAQDVGKLA